MDHPDNASFLVRDNHLSGRRRTGSSAHQAAQDERDEQEDSEGGVEPKDHQTVRAMLRFRVLACVAIGSSSSGGNEPEGDDHGDTAGRLALWLVG